MKHAVVHPKKMKNAPEMPIALRMNLKEIPMANAHAHLTTEQMLTSSLLTSSATNGQVVPPSPMPNAKR